MPWMISCFLDTHSAMTQRSEHPSFFITGIGEGQLQRLINRFPSRLLFLSISMGKVARFILDVPVTLFPSNVIWRNPSLSWGSRGFKWSPVPWGKKLQGCHIIWRQRQPRKKYWVSSASWIELAYLIALWLMSHRRITKRERKSHLILCHWWGRRFCGWTRTIWSIWIKSRSLVCFCPIALWRRRTQR